MKRIIFISLFAFALSSIGFANLDDPKSAPKEKKQIENSKEVKKSKSKKTSEGDSCCTPSKKEKKRDKKAE